MTEETQGYERGFWAVVAALTAILLTTSLMNLVVFPQFDSINTYARDISVYANAAALLVLGMLATFRPHFLRTNTYFIATALCAGTGAVLLPLALALGSSALLVVSSSLVAIGRALITVLVGLSALRLSSKRASGCVVLSFLISSACKVIAWLVPIWAGLVLFLVLPFVSLALAWKLAKPYLVTASQSEAPASLAITHPSSFLPLASQVFVCLFLFHVTFGFSLRYGEAGGVPVSDFMVIVPIAVVAIYVLAGKKMIPSDLLTELSVVLVVAGFLLVVTDFSLLSDASNVLLSSGSTLFEIVAWVVLVAIGSKNHAGALAVFAWGRGVSTLGTPAGAALGVWCNGLFAADPVMLAVVADCLIVLFVGYALIGLKHFSFKDVIEGVEPVSYARATNPEEEFEERCSDISQKYGLTPRELEVFKLLARGHDREYIEKTLVVSRNTVKVHVKHVYAKLGIHSHVELIALVQEKAH